MVKGAITLLTNGDPEIALYNTQVVGLKVYTDFILSKKKKKKKTWRNSKMIKHAVENTEYFRKMKQMKSTERMAVATQ
jgi:hypothetical protein